jgi:hypothetical protein
VLRAAIEHSEPATAGIKATQSLVLGYCDQALAGLDDAETPMRTIVGRFDIDAQEHLLHVRQVLAGFLEEDLVELRQIDPCALCARVGHARLFLAMRGISAACLNFSE